MQQSLYMFRVSQHPSSGVLKTVTAASGTGHNIGTATSLQRGQIGISESLNFRIPHLSGCPFYYEGTKQHRYDTA